MKEPEISIIQIIAVILFVSCWFYVGMTFSILGIVLGWIPAWGVAFGFMFGVSLADEIFR